MTCTLYPAIDVRDGRVVRLCQGDYARETRYMDEPLGVARGYARAGATWLHLVDLDAARAGGYTLAPLLAAIKASTPLRVQTGGGVRDEADVAALLAAGADRVVVGSLAVRQPMRVIEWVTRYGADRITIALDACCSADGIWRLPTHGWTEHSDAQLEPMLRTYAASGLQHVLCTDIDRDGMLTGPNLDLYRRILASCPGLALQASGGVRDIADVAAARAVGCAGVVLGKALLDGCFTLDDALAAPLAC